MSNNNENKLVPKFRFPGFSKNWFVIPVSEVCDVFRGSPLSKAELDENGSKPCIHYGELFTKYSEVISSIYSKTNRKDGFKSKVGDILMPSSDVTPDGLAKASVIMHNDVILGGDMNILRPIEDIKPIFLSYLLNRSKREIIKLVSGTTVKHIYPSQISNCHLPIVYDDTEQQRIASCLSSLDDVITAESQKLETLKEHKKGLLQNLFPQEGEIVPKFRFKEFENSGEWVVIELGSFCKSLSSGKDKNIEDGEYELYGSTGIIVRTENASYEGDYILVARVGANAGFLNKVKGKFGVTDNTLVIDLIKKDIINFIYYSLENICLKELVFGSGQPLITGSQLKSLQVLIPPDENEQQRIAACLSSLDDLINAQSQKIEALKEHKKGLLQGLFPQMSEP